tara:strand:- start:193 stop:909 length:717 start_codon:yes stop_codon:yes gene_type:complete
MSHQGDFEQRKFKGRRNNYNTYIDWIEKKEIRNKEILEHFPTYVGHMTLSRSITFYELYKKTKGIAGHVADVGIYKGFSSFLMAKLIKLNEPESLTQVHGFEWFKGMSIDTIDSKVESGSYTSDKEELIKLIELQGLEDILLVHDLDLTTELDNFFNNLKHIMFKLVILDVGFYNVLKECIPHFWSRLTPGGIMIFDQYNHELAPGESMAIRENLPNIKIETLNNSWTPTAFAVKTYV